MKNRIILLTFLLGFIPMLNAQWTSPGNGSTFDLDALVENSDGCVVRIGKLPYSMDRPVYRFVSDVIIAPTDRLVFPTNNFIEFDDVTLTIQGALTIEGTFSGYSSFVDKSHENPDAQPCIRFEDATDASIIKACVFLAFSGIKIINSEVTFDDCVISYFDTELQSSAVNYMNCDPVFTACHFYNNEGPAIGSAVNVFGSPQILNCYFDHNVTNNANQPQINLGPGSNDTIRIVGCTIEGGGNNMVGGISIADLMGTGATKILLKDNIVKNNRYGYNQQGYNLSSVIIGNQFTDNNLETNPMNGGSGISIYGVDENNKAVLRDNVISGNLWGITVINKADINLGTEDDWGHNQIHDNGNGGVIYDLYNNSTSDIMAVGNYWGTTNEQEIEDHIFHQLDDASLGLVNYIPFSTDDAIEEAENTAFDVWPNPAQGRFTMNGQGTMTITNALGQTILTMEIDGKESIALPRGLYVVRLGDATRKVVVE